MGDNYIKTPPHKSIIKLALMSLRGEGAGGGEKGPVHISFFVEASMIGGSLE